MTDKTFYVLFLERSDESMEYMLSHQRKKIIYDLNLILFNSQYKDLFEKNEKIKEIIENYEKNQDFMH